jgi:predicted P-loop ATPase
VKESDGPIFWREFETIRHKGRPVPKATLFNTRLAIDAMAITCSHDTFHNKVLFGFRGDLNLHKIDYLVGDVTDNGILALRQRISERFGFDPGTQNCRDAVTTLAVENCFNPVADMLDKAQGDWDGVERLDRMAVDYVNCEDTPLNRAIMRKTMIAGVRKATRLQVRHDNRARKSGRLEQVLVLALAGYE